MTSKSNKSPSYLTRNRVGTYIFQVRIPRQAKPNNMTIKPIFWHSLGTKDYVEAVRRSRRMWVMYDSIADKFNDPEVYAKAMELLKRYDDACSKGEHMEFIESLDETLKGGDSDLFEKAVEARGDARLRVAFASLEKEKDGLKQQVEVLQNARSNVGPSSGGSSGVTKEDLAVAVAQSIALANKGDGPNFSDENDRLLSSVIDEYMTFKIDNNLKPGSRKPYYTKLRLFESILQSSTGGEKVKLSHITDERMRNYADVMVKFPRNYKTQSAFKNKDVKYVVDYVLPKSRAELESQGIVISTNKKENFRLVKSFLAWVKTRKYPLIDGLETHLTIVNGVESKEEKIEANLPYSPDELKLLFENDKYRFAKKRSGAIDYWAPLIAIHSGATLAEICQLHFEDIRIVDGITVIDINANGWKILKNEDGRPRLIPVHPNLVKLGFLEFVEKQKSLVGGDRIFPEAVRDEDDKFDSTGSRFSTFRQRCGITVTDKTKTFHSFRSTVSTFLRENACPEGVANDIIGHTSEQRSETYKTYAKNKTLVQITNEWIKKIDFGIDFNYPKLWGD